MERYFFYLLYLLLGCSLCGCSRKQAPKQTQDPDTETTIPYADTIAAPVPPAPAKSRTARYLDSLGFVNIAEADSSIAIDLMYTRADNFTGTLLYEDLKEAYLHPDAMKSLKRAQRLLKEQYPGYSLIVYDAARPLSVQQKMWNVVKGTSKYIYVSNPSRGGGLHNYGLAVDISILDDKGTPLPMGTPVDHLGREAHITEEAVLVAQGKLTEQERNWLRPAADAAAIYQRKLWAEQEKQSLEEMEAHGVEIIYPDKQPFMDAAAPMIERFKNDPVFHDLIDQIQNTHEKDN